MIQSIKEETVKRVLNTKVNVQVKQVEDTSDKVNNEQDVSKLIRREKVAKITSTSGGSSDGTLKKQPIKKKNDIGRNEQCPCGSGLKWKKCSCAEYHQ